MQKSLFKKYLRITSLIILVSFFCLGVVLVVFISRYWHVQQQDLLQRNAEGVAQVAASSMLDETENTFTIDGSRMGEFVSAFSENIDAHIIVTDVKGNIVIAHNGIRLDSEQDLLPAALDQALIDRVVQEGGFSETGNLNGYFGEDYFVVGVPIVVTSETGHQTTIGTAFAASTLTFVTNFRSEVIKMFFLAGIAAFIVAFGVTWLYSYKMTRPLRDMAEATKSFALGDFSVRVPVYSDDEVGELAKAFNRMAETLASSESMSRNFIANVSHELKTPMTTISGFIDGIVDGTIPREKEAHYLKIVSQEVKRLSRLVKTMLDLSRIDSGKMVLRSTRFDLSNTIFVTLLSFEDTIEKKRIEIRGLENSKPLFVNGDPDMIHQVLYNLLENAVKFTNENGYIEIHTVEAADRVAVSIRNSGQGISADDLKMIFDRFYKTDKSRSQDKTGMGLGLYIVKTMIQLHGGNIQVESVENDYTVFEFWIPYKTDKNEKKEKKAVKIGKTGKTDKQGVIEVVDAAEKKESRREAPVTEKKEIVDVTDFAVDTTEQHSGKKREGKKGK